LSADQSTSDPHALAAVLHRSLHALDRMERDSTGDRLSVVADLIAQAVGLPGWSAFSDGSGAVPRLVLRHLLRPVTVPDEHFDVRLGPVVDGYGLHATATTGPHALRRRLESSGLCGILVVGGYAPDATRWVLECYADHEAPPLIPLLPTLYATVQAALSFPQSARPAPEVPGGGLRRLSLVDSEAHRASDAE
jgi:hypothetical protein